MSNTHMSYASLAAVNNLRTGNMLLDMSVAILLPIMFTFICDGRGRKLVELIIGFVRSKTRYSTTDCIRTITYTSTNRGCFEMGDKRNDSLQKALQLYLTAQGVSFRENAKIELTSLQDARSCHMLQDKYDPLATYRLTWTAPDNEWVELGEGIKFRQYFQKEPQAGSGGGGSGDNKLREQLIFELKSADGPERIDTLVDNALSWYKKELASTRDDNRYFYTITTTERFSMSSSKGKGDDDDGLRYKRYALSDHKTFESLFFKEKTSLLNLLNDFSEGKGKYGVKGYPQKLGVLLHGPPGTGKTSLIKALAHQTGRSIVSIPLAQIKTNQMLMDVMYDLKLKVDGVESAPSLKFKDVIFVIEDIDAASKVVLRRDPNKSEKDMGEVSVTDLSSAAAAVGDTALASALARAHRGDPMTAPPPPPPPKGLVEEGPKKPSVVDLMGDLLKPRSDELNLAGILNVLDGVVDTPGRLVIVTSNHPDKLDDALIRPGRIDRQIYLGYIQADEAAQMCSHYFGVECNAAQRARLDELLTERAIAPPKTPAALEQLCARFSTIDELLGELSAEVDEATGASSELSKALSSGLSSVGCGKAPPPPSRVNSLATPSSPSVDTVDTEDVDGGEEQSEERSEPETSEAEQGGKMPPSDASLLGLIGEVGLKRQVSGG